MSLSTLRALASVSAFGAALLAAGTAPASSDERELPDYDGRQEAPAAPGDVLIWVPRVLLFPVYVVTEYVIRTPIGFLIAGAESASLPQWLYDFFTFDDRRAGLVPTFLVDFDFYPSVGVYGFWNGVLWPEHDVRLRAAIGGGEWLAASFSDRYRLSYDPYDRIALTAHYERRPDFTYFGLGPDTRQTQLVRYGRDLRELSLTLDQRLWRASSLHAEIALRAADFRRGGYGDDPTLEDAVSAGELPPPPGYVGGYTLVRSELTVAFDNRQPRPTSASGTRLAATLAHAGELRGEQSFVYYEATAGGFWDLNHRGRVVILGVNARFADPIGGGSIPFTELVTLGGNHPMRGLYPGRLYDRSAIVGGLGYRWPIWIWLDGALRAEVGNVFGEHLAGLRAERLRWSGAIGVESVGTPDNSFRLMFGVGSETFESGGRIDSFRLVAGTTSGF